MTSIFLTKAGVTGIPKGTKEQGQRVDFKPDQLDLIIETKGYRLAWSRAAQCPCAPINNQTEQANPNCPICNGIGWLYFRPHNNPLDETQVGQLDNVQKKILDNNKAVVVRGVMSSISTQYQPLNELGRRLEGTLLVTVRHENKLGYYDRIVNLDSLIVYSEILESKAPDELVAARYLISGVNLLRSVDTIYSLEDFTLENGKIRWKDGRAPEPGTRLVCHYLTHPTWLVMEHPHAIRSSPVKFKTPTPQTPLGETRPLPIQAVVKYEFMR